jgi:hypothetical protein
MKPPGASIIIAVCSARTECECRLVYEHLPATGLGFVARPDGALPLSGRRQRYDALRAGRFDAGAQPANRGSPAKSKLFLDSALRAWDWAITREPEKPATLAAAAGLFRMTGRGALPRLVQDQHSTGRCRAILSGQDRSGLGHLGLSADQPSRRG